VEKLVYSLWRPALPAVDDFRVQLLGALGPALSDLPAVHGIRLAVADSAVSAAAARRMESHAPLPDALLSLWVDDAGAAAAWEPLIDQHVARKSAYLVAEAEPLVSQRHYPSAPGERVYGMCQVVYLRKPSHLECEQWLNIWKGSHTQLAMDIQSTFGYRQNVVVRSLGEGTLPFDAIVEEHFPAAAMDSDHAFYDTGGDEQLLQQRMTAMIESCTRFIDFEHIDVIPMSEYIIKRLSAP
jgi:hypothetical protein